MAPFVDFTGLRAALFDLDGTLVRTFIDFPAMRDEIHKLSASHGVHAEADEDVLALIDRMAAAARPERCESIRREAYALLEAREREGCAEPEPIPGALDLLRHLRRSGLFVAVITRNSRPIAEDLIRRMDLEQDVLVARGDVPEFKPHPAPVLRACRVLGVAPADAIMVGDFWPDAAAGRAAVVRATIGIQWPYDPPGRFDRFPPDILVASLTDVADLLMGTIALRQHQETRKRS